MKGNERMLINDSFFNKKNTEYAEDVTTIHKLLRGSKMF